MTRLVGIMDVVTFAALVAAAGGLIVRWRQGLRRDVSRILAGLLAVTLFHHFSNMLEWLSVTKSLVPIEDFVEVLEPLLWGVFFYAFLQGQAERRLRDSEERYRTLVDNIDLGITLIDASYRVLMSNAPQARMAGKPLGQIVGAPCHEAFYAQALPCSHCPGSRAMVTGRAEEAEVEITPRGGAPAVVRIQAFPVLGPGGKATGFIEVTEDLTERKQAAEQLRESEARYHKILNTISDSIALIDRHGRVIEVNETFCATYGYPREEAIGLPARRFVRPGSHGGLAGFLRAVQAGEMFRGETVNVRRDGSTFPTEVRGSRIRMHGEDYLLAVIRDVTERKQAEEQRRQLEAQVQQTQKLESLGVLAGGIAHDFNNLLVAILGNADLALMDMSPVALQRPVLEEIKKAAKRAADLTNQMLAYSGKGQFIVRALDLNELVTEMGHLLNVSISKKVVLRYDLAEDLPPVSADVNQMRQVVMNLITNASEAIGEGTGTITVRTSVVEADRQYLAETFLDEGLPEGFYLCVEVCDTGCGMTAEAQARLFDPFYTTKFTGRGLGLAAVLGIVRGHHGAIKVYSEAGKGSTFRVLLPVSESAAEPVPPPPEAELDRTPATGTLLVADDEASVRTVAMMMLQRQGYRVLSAADGQDAVAVFQAHALEIDAVLLDMTMPHLSGEEAFREMRRIRPDVKVILTSGYNEQEATHRFAGKGLAAFIQKPFELSRLLGTVRDVLKS